ncbi:hypothetical protein V7S43_011698 [Phytophthora oleae]|uniref:Uncharacterized protein n=1 Tax=Phytophthora oleae TaxID=2107226 RepID=A0ABD3FE65_9STRA
MGALAREESASDAESVWKYQFTMCLLEAAKTNSVDIARWLFERFPYGVRQKVISEAAKAGALEILWFFRANGTVIGNDEEEEDEYAEERERWKRLPRTRFGGLEAARAAVAQTRHVDIRGVRRYI